MIHSPGFVKIALVVPTRVASLAGVNPALVHYYFPVTDDLFLAIWRRGAERTLDRHRAATQAPQPLRAMWKLSRETRGTGLVMEFAALANHRKAIRDEKLKGVQAQIQGDQLRVSGKKKDDLQAVIALLKGKDFGIALQFTNYR